MKITAPILNHKILSKIMHFVFYKLGYRIYKNKYLPKGIDWMHDLDRLIISNVKTIFDIGANEGQTAFDLLDHFREAKVYSFEPASIPFFQLNIMARRDKRLMPVQKAVGSSPGISFLSLKENSVMNKIEKNANNLFSDDYEEIKITTVNDFCNEYFIKEIDILKTDTEGFDADVLMGASNLLEKGLIKFIFSEATIRFDDKQRTQYHAIHSIMDKFSYSPYAIYDLYHLQSPVRINYFNVLFVSPLINLPESR